jgi:hypothetical protein
VTGEVGARGYWEGPGLRRLWTAFALAPLAWTVDQGLGYPLVKWACANGDRGVLLVIHAVAMVLTVTGAWLGWVLLTRARQGDDGGGRPVDWSVFLAWLAIGLNVIVALAIVSAAVPQSVIDTCL